MWWEYTWFLMCCSGAVTRLAQLSHSMTITDRKRHAARIQRGRPERLGEWTQQAQRTPGAKCEKNGKILIDGLTESVIGFLVVKGYN